MGAGPRGYSQKMYKGWWTVSVCLNLSAHGTDYESLEYGKGYSVGGHSLNASIKYIIQSNMRYSSTHGDMFWQLDVPPPPHQIYKKLFPA